MKEHKNLEVEVDENQLIVERYRKLARIRDLDQPSFPNDFRRTHLASVLMDTYGDTDRDTLTEERVAVAVCGRIMLRRIMGKSQLLNDPRYQWSDSVVCKES